MVATANNQRTRNTCKNTNGNTKRASNKNNNKNNKFSSNEAFSSTSQNIKAINGEFVNGVFVEAPITVTLPLQTPTSTIKSVENNTATTNVIHNFSKQSNPVTTVQNNNNSINHNNNFNNTHTVQHNARMMPVDAYGLSMTASHASSVPTPSFIGGYPSVHSYSHHHLYAAPIQPHAALYPPIAHPSTSVPFSAPRATLHPPFTNTNSNSAPLLLPCALVPSSSSSASTNSITATNTTASAQGVIAKQPPQQLLKFVPGLISFADLERTINTNSNANNARSDELPKPVEITPNHDSATNLHCKSAPRRLQSLPSPTNTKFWADGDYANAPHPSELTVPIFA